MKILYSFIIFMCLVISACSPQKTEMSQNTVSQSEADWLQSKQEKAPTLKILSQDIITVSASSNSALPIYFSPIDDVNIQVSGKDATAVRVKNNSLYLDGPHVLGDKLRFDITLSKGQTQTTKSQVVLIQSQDGLKDSQTQQDNWGEVVFNTKPRSVEACFPSIKALDTSETFYLDYVDVFVTREALMSASEYTAHGVSVNNNTFCITNLGFGVSYQSFFKAGFPFKRSAADSNAIQVFTTPDMPPSLTLSGNAFVLPTYADTQIPIDMVNLERVEIIVLRDSIEQVREKFEDSDFNDVDDYYYLDSIKRNSHLIKQETINISPKKNVTQTYKYDISEVLNTHPPGAYTVIAIPQLANAPYRWDSMQMRSIIYTDIALVATQTFEGVHVSAMSYETAQPIAELDVELVAKNAEVIEGLKTNSDGEVFFPLAKINGKGALSAKHIRAIRGKEIGLIDLHFDELDLSVHDIAGIDAVKPIDIFLFTERGVYRNAEIVSINGIVKERATPTDYDYPVVVKIRKANGDIINSQTVSVSKNGVFQWNYTIPKSERTGQWTIEAYIGESQQRIASHAFLVADYVPETIESFVSIEDTLYKNKALSVDVKADYLYGAPASGLTVEGYVQFSKDRRPFNQYPHYLFGKDDSSTSIREILPNSKLDAKGQQTVTIPPNVISASKITDTLKGQVHISVTEDSGRKNRTTQSIRALLLPSYVGIKAESTFGHFSINNTLDFSVINLSQLGEVVPNNAVRYRIMEVDWDYFWYRSNGYWEYVINRRDVALADENTVMTDANGMLNIAFTPDNWTRYRLELIDVASGHETHYNFKSGWSNSESQFSSPQNVDISLDKSSYTLGDTVTVNLKAPYQGRLQLSVANQAFYNASWHDVTDEQLSIELPVDKAWQDQVYITATVYRPGDKINGATRAVGVKHVTIDQPQLVADISLQVAEKIMPQQTLDIAVESDLNAEGEVIFFAVDQGILNLTNYKTPEPLSYFLTKQAYPNKIYDLYQYLIQYKNGELLEQNVGGDSANDDSADKFFEPVVYASEPVTVDINGRAKTSFTLPYYNGRLRVFAVGVDEQKMGHVSASTIVSSPITLDAITPRFVHIDDRFELGLTLNNIEYGESDINIVWSATDGVVLAENQSTLTLAPKEKAQAFVNVKAKTVGQQRITANISVDGETYQTYIFNVNVINQRPEVYQSESVRVWSKHATEVDFDISHLISPKIDFSLTSYQAFNSNKYVNDLRRYPLGCLEQTTSKAWAFSLNDKVISDKEKIKLIKNAIAHIDTMKLSSNAYSMWPNGYSAQPWLTLYASEFMLHAYRTYKDNFTELNGAIVERVKWAKAYNGGEPSINIFALYFLAEVNPSLVDLGDLRYTTQMTLKNSDKYSMQDISLLMLANDRVGYTDNVELLFAVLSQREPGVLDRWSRNGYDSTIKALTVKAYSILQTSLLSQTQKEEAQRTIESLHKAMYEKRYLSTQERAWLIRLSNALTQSQRDELFDNTRINGLPIDLDTVKQALVKDEGTFEISNSLSSTVYFNVSANGHSDKPIEAYANNLALSTRYLDVVKAKEISLDNVQKGDELIIEHTITLTSDDDTELSIVAPVPAGFEIEDPKLSSLRDLGTNSSRAPTFTEYRDDKFLAAWSLPRGKKSTANGQLIIRYVVVAVTKGEFTQPSIVVEDMYRTANRAVSGETSIVIR